jgi:predicted permease
MSALDALAQDLRYGLRLIRKHPLLSAAMIATLSLGIGLDAGAFTLIDGMLFRARVKDSPSTFVQIDARDSTPDSADRRSGPGGRGGLPMVTRDDYAAYRDRSNALGTLAAWAPVHATLGGGAASPAQDIVPILVTCNFFTVFTTPPIAGRVFREDECAAPGGAPVVVIGEDLWRGRYAANPTIVGTAIEVNDRPFTIVGVMPAAYDGTLRAPMWIPYTMQATFLGGRDLFREPAAAWLVMIGRLRPGVTREAAAADLTVIARQQDQLVPGRKTMVRLTNGSLFDMMPSPALALSIVPLVMGALSLVLLIACANVTMLLLSRAAARRHEIAVRLSLGATRGRLIRMLLTEGVLLAVFAGPWSAWVAYEVPSVWKSRMPQLPFYPFQFDLRTFSYMAAITLGAGCLAALAPALEAMKGSLSASLHGENTQSGRTWRTADLLVMAQVAMSLVLLVGAAIMVRGEEALRSAPPGFDGEHVLLATPRVTVPPYAPEAAARFYRQLTDRVRALRGVRAVGFSSAPPLGDLEDAVETIRLRQSVRDAAPDVTASVNRVTPGYFAALSIPIVRGRGFLESDAGARVRPLVVSEALARALSPAHDALGRLVEDADGRPGEIVGIAGNIASVTGDATAEAIAYAPRAADAAGDVMLVRFDGGPADTARAVRDAMRSLDANATAEPRTIAAVRQELAERFMRIVGVVVFLGAVAIGLATIGLYGVAAFAAGRRAKEMGIRIALGATRSDIARLVLWSGARPILLGLAAGMAVATPAARALERLFARLPIDWRIAPVFTVTGALLTLVAFVAMFGPAARAATANPVRALRQD